MRDTSYKEVSLMAFMSICKDGWNRYKKVLFVTWRDDL